MAFITITCPRSGRPIKVASKKRAIRMMVNAQRELLKDNKANKYVPDLVHVVRERSKVTYTGLVCSTDKQGVRNYHAMPDRPRSPDLAPVDWAAHDEIVAQRLIRHNKAAPQRKRKTK